MPPNLTRTGRHTLAMPRPPGPLTIPWHGGNVRARHDDPRLSSCSPRASVHLAAATLATTPDGLPQVPEATTGEDCRIQVREGDEVTVGLWER